MKQTEKTLDTSIQLSTSTNDAMNVNSEKEGTIVEQEIHVIKNGIQ